MKTTSFFSWIPGKIGDIVKNAYRLLYCLVFVSFYVVYAVGEIVFDAVKDLQPRHFFLGLQVVDEETNHWFSDLVVCAVIYVGIDFLVQKVF